MMPHLQARESLIAAERIGVGIGAPAGRDVFRRWQRQAQGSSRRAQKATPEQLNAIGIGVTFVPPRGQA